MGKKKSTIDVEGFKQVVSDLADQVADANDQVEALPVDDVTSKDAEELQRHFALMARDVTQAMVKLYTHIRTARSSEKLAEMSARAGISPPSSESKLTRQEREDFKSFCQQATHSQLINIVAKEREAGREEYAQIAISVAQSRGIQVVQS